ncbi:phosphoribosylformylglycinamidine synthase [Thermodesulfitimonas autotrophica]|uniref:Phosphoribosylformylglycinamidine synthase subunit PurQ n=1 Tax=Thermodesulfitimonas autotrophica TaxID=1894989 RepID=A0A3N5BVD8_9THEO|nr:phosphoribosylformylglycinamidine synthase I [Thermodesulfitimonas autotrophica]RPF49865.1 phosphoribosylformylglycinamidine synthase [Thermodesulfitimonas autotrophica]
MRPPVMVLRTDGTNCDVETAYAFEAAGGAPRLVHVNQLRAGREKLTDYRVLVIPGGFSYGDDVHSGKILAVELTSFLREEIESFVAAGGLVLGICNGFQVLVRTGLLPFGEVGPIRATLMVNDSARFECRWVRLRVEESPCVFTRGAAGRVVTFQAAHGEGKFFTDPATLNKIERQGLVVFRYVDAAGRPTQQYPDNPNGSLGAIAGITDPTGRIMGLMPHPERNILPHHHPNWRRLRSSYPDGRFVFENAVAAARKS